MAEEQVENTASQLIIMAVSGGSQLAIRLAGAAGAALYKALTGAGKWAVTKTAATIHERINSGQMSEQRLQHISDGDIHELTLNDPDSIKEVTKSLKQAGVNYHIEQGPDGNWLHFAGKDTDHVMHSVERAFNKLGLQFDIEQLSTTLTEQPTAANKEPQPQTSQDAPQSPETTADRAPEQSGASQKEQATAITPTTTKQAPSPHHPSASTQQPQKPQTTAPPDAHNDAKQQTNTQTRKQGGRYYEKHA
ncbi:DUF3801 domain-containing protein [Bifidobacterium crudilactis]|jgi:hypothetical protein|uniref:DUF3801 domain-containing protein n=1 Tax=Bifidobacterium crudilactis TaxID=327277 RepID=UPI002F35297A